MGVRENIRKQIDVLGYGGNLTRFARDKGFSNSYLNEILNGKRRFNEHWLNKISKALGVEPWQLLADRPLVPYEAKEPTLVFNSPEGQYEGIKLFEDPVSLGPGFELSQMVPVDYAPILKKLLPKGYESDKDRVIAYPAKGISMEPTINDGSIIWIDKQNIEPKEGHVFAFMIKNQSTSVTIKRLIKIDRRFLIIDGDNKDPGVRKTEELKDFPMVLSLKDYEAEEICPIRGRVIWVLNRLVEKPKK
ncbi:MAG: hypothetical protein MUP27_04185 [Desulfobacterales bacterium]|nr:hypothetical protein [Desulfobacterales bacterium]